MILFFVWTDVQLINCVNVKCNYYREENAEIIVYLRGRISDSLLEIVRRSEVFSAIYILKLPDFFEEGRVNKENRLGFINDHIRLKEYLSCKIKTIIGNKRYEKFLVASFWSETLNIYKNVRKNNKNIQIEIVEEGMANYTGVEKWIYRAAPSSALKAWLREIFYCGYLGVEARKGVSCLYLYRPELVWAKSVKKTKKIPIINNENDIIFKIFSEWQEELDNSLYEEQKIIYIADEFELEGETNDVLEYMIRFMPDFIRRFLIIKPHPLCNFKGKGSITKSKEGILIDGRVQPVENILFRYDMRDKILIVNHSSVLLYLKCMLDKEPYTIFTYRIRQSYKKGLVDRFDFFSERLKGIFVEPERLMVPDTLEEFQKIIEKIGRRII